VKIINRYILKEHVGPFVFALSALTSLLMLQYIARRFGELVGKGIAWQVIVQFFLLAIPFTVALTLPMSVLVAVLYAFSRLASENEVNALKAGGVSTRTLLWPPLVLAVLLAMFMVGFNDQIMPRANHQLATLQMDILKTKPTFALRPQVLNTVREGNLYLRSAQIDQASQHMHDVTIYDLQDQTRRRTIYADSGILALAANQKDLAMTLFNGVMLSVNPNRVGELNRLYYKQNRLRVRDVASQFQQSNADTTTKGEREMSVCEMQRAYDVALRQFRQAEFDRDRADMELQAAKGKMSARDVPPPHILMPVKAGGIGAAYCRFLDVSRQWIDRALKVKEAHAAQVPAAQAPAQAPAQTPVAQAPAQVQRPIAPTIAPSSGRVDYDNSGEIAKRDAQMRLDEAQHRRNRYAVEIQKKFSLATACIVFVLVGAPIAVRFPRGGVGVVIGVSFLVFAIYYVGLIGGEELANRSILSPFWAMWGDNVIFLIAGIGLVARMGHETATTRGGDWREALAVVRARITRPFRRGPTRTAGTSA
jgi:lipopolysaccharide export system permease protein